MVAQATFFGNKKKFFWVLLHSFAKNWYINAADDNFEGGKFMIYQNVVFIAFMGYFLQIYRLDFKL